LVRMGGFELQDPFPECNAPFVIATLRPWIDVNNVGSLVLKELSKRFGATEIARLARPGEFYDFTRYRPVIDLDEGIRDLAIPNTTVHLAKREGLNDLLLLRLLEPHAHAEHYISSVMKILKAFKATKYILIGGMYDAVPHTRPLLVSGYGMGEGALEDARKAGVLPITYRGPSTIANLITKEAAESGIDAVAFIVSLPQYVDVDDDYAGKVRLMEILNLLYGIPVSREDFEKALEQRNLISNRIENSPEIRALLPQLEIAYDMRTETMGSEESPRVTSEMEEMIWNITGKDIGKA
jgi:predicted ATP-grasp superfamily ATP-dependent carboligase